MEDIMFREWKFLLQEGAIVDHCFHRDYLNQNQNHPSVGGGTSTSTTNSSRNRSDSKDAGVSTNGGKTNHNVMPFVSNYVLYMIVELMERHITVGMEVGLFTGCWHLLTGFWYLDFLSSARLNVVKGMRDCMQERKVLERNMVLMDGDHHDVNSRKGNIGGNGSNDSNGSYGSYGAAVGGAGTSSKYTNGGGRGKKKGKKAKKGQQSKNNGSPGKSKQTVEPKPIPEKIEDEIDVLVLKMKQFMYRGIVRVSSRIGDWRRVQNRESRVKTFHFSLLFFFINHTLLTSYF